MVRPIVDAGTDEGTWGAWPAPAGWPVLALDDRARTVPPLVVAPHPDDEVLGVGGLVAMLAGGVEIVVVTDGEASHPDSTVHSRAALAAIRRAETVTACGLLGVVPAAIAHLGHPDGGVDEAALTDALTTRLAPGRWCVTTWRGDGHPDHEAVGRAAAVACRRTGDTAGVPRVDVALGRAGPSRRAVAPGAPGRPDRGGQIGQAGRDRRLP